MSVDSLKAPWTEEQVRNLNEFQRSGYIHPFTCGSGSRSDGAHLAVCKQFKLRDNGQLLATRSGWICPGCDYTQDWAHDFMLDGSAVVAGRTQRAWMDSALASRSEPNG